MLYLVPTPIGNLNDITYRAVEVLKMVDAILCEDTRTSGKLLQHWEISKPLYPYHQHNEHKVTEGIIQQLKAGKTLAIITDAGTPGISDPGFLLVRACIQEGIDVNCLPGSTAFVPALVQSGLAAHAFVFEGFLPLKKGRKTKFEQLAQETRTVIFYESPHRIVKTLEEMLQYFEPERRVSVSREISKRFEETQRGSLLEVGNWFKTHAPKGEFVVVVEGR